MVKPVAVIPLPGYRLHLKYADGVEGEVDLSRFVGKGVFAEWHDVTAFEAVTIGDHGEIRWNENIDICSDALYLEITRKSPDDIFPNLKTPADA